MPAPPSPTPPRSPARSRSSTAARACSSSRSRTRRTPARSASSSSTTSRPARIGMSGTDATHHDPGGVDLAGRRQRDQDGARVRARAVTLPHGAPVGAAARRLARQHGRRPRVGPLPVQPPHQQRQRPVRQPGARHGRRLVRLRGTAHVRQGGGPQRPRQRELRRHLRRHAVSASADRTTRPTSSTTRTTTASAGIRTRAT